MKKIILLSFILIVTSLKAYTSELEKFNTTKSSISFTENKGQISDQNYNPRPDVLYSGEANELSFYIRNNGVSYQTYRVDSWKQEDAEWPESLKEMEGLDSIPDQMTVYRTDINWIGFNNDYTVENGEAVSGLNN